MIEFYLKEYLTYPFYVPRHSPYFFCWCHAPNLGAEGTKLNPIFQCLWKRHIISPQFWDMVDITWIFKSFLRNARKTLEDQCIAKWLLPPRRWVFPKYFPDHLWKHYLKIDILWVALASAVAVVLQNEVKIQLWSTPNTPYFDVFLLDYIKIAISWLILYPIGVQIQCCECSWSCRCSNVWTHSYSKEATQPMTKYFKLILIYLRDI